MRIVTVSEQLVVFELIVCSCNERLVLLLSLNKYANLLDNSTGLINKTLCLRVFAFSQKTSAFSPTQFTDQRKCPLTIIFASLYPLIGVGAFLS